MLQSILNTSKDIRTSKKELSLQILLVFILPIIFFQTGIISVKYRIFVLVLIVTTLLIILFFEKWTPRMLGLTSLNLKKFVVPYGIFTLIGTLSIIRFGEIIGNQEITNWWTHSHFLYLFFVVSFFQEIAYRGYLIPALGKLTNVPIFIIFANIVLFTYLHVIFINPFIGLPLAFIGGAGFSYMYIRYPNLILIIISHSILNFFAVLYGFYSVPVLI